MTQVRTAIVRRGRAHRDELHVTVGNTARHVGGKRQPAGADIADDYLLQPWLVDWNLCALQCGNFFGIRVDAQDIIAQLRKAYAGNEPHITGSEQGEIHGRRGKKKQKTPRTGPRPRGRAGGTFPPPPPAGAPPGAAPPSRWFFEFFGPL